uniref:Uncharacterized protein n=1 Tax=Anopheles gambiae TaxID=7165 RepID=A0A499FWW0_ANOGA
MGALVLLAAVVAGVMATDTVPTIPPSTADTAVLPALAAPFLTVNRCEEAPLNRLHVLDPSKIPPDCRCPPGFRSLRADPHSTRALCVGVIAPRPWQDGCVSSGTGSDYYDLDAIEQAEVRQLLVRMNLTECWISARRLLRYGGLVRRLPGTQWNAPLELPSGLAVSNYTTADPDCATVRLTEQRTVLLAYRNCSTVLPRLCLYREAAMLRLHCGTHEYTTRYASHQRYCFNIRRSGSRQPGPTESFTIDSNRKRQLLFELLYASRECNNSANVIYADQRPGTTHHAHKRDGGAALVPIVSAEPSGHECASHQRLQIDRDSLVPAAEGAAPGMYLYFDRAHHKLLLTVYGDRWYWREDPAASGFVCFANANDEQLIRPRVKKLRWRGQTPSDDHTNRTMYEVKLTGDDGPPRPYWCEAHLVPNFALLQTDTVLARRKASCRHYFAATIELLLERSGSRVVAESPDAWRLKDYDGLVEDHLKERRKRLPELKHVFAAIKAVHVKRLEDFWISANSDWYTVRLLVHIATKCARKWDKADKLPEPERNEIGLPAQYLDHYQTYKSLTAGLESLNSERVRFLGVNSTEYCLPESLHLAPGKNVWWPARLGESVAPRNLCLIEQSGLPVTRRCLGDYLYGCAWDWNPGSELCTGQHRPTTSALYQYSVTSLNHSVLGEVLTRAGEILAVPEQVIPADLFYLSKTLENVPPVLEQSETGSPDEERRAYFCNVSTILSRVMYLNETTVVLSQRALNTTNILLDATETIVNRLAVANDTRAMMLAGDQYDCRDRGGAIQRHVQRHDGTVLFRTARLIVLIADPTVANVTGLALFRARNLSLEDLSDAAENSESEDDFSGYTLRYLYMNQSLEDLLAESDLEIGSFIPQHVIEGLDELNTAFRTPDDEEQDPDAPDESTTTLPSPVEHPDPPVSPAPPPLRVIITIYYNDHAFRETKNGTIARPNSKIISVSLPGYGSRMPDEIPIYTREMARELPSRCGYWSFEADNATEFGHWSYDECRLLNASDRGVSLCGCFHLTSFSRLTQDIQMVETVGVSQKLIADQGTLALDIITAIGCSMSLLGVMGIFATAALFPSWRVKASSKILLQLSCAIAIEMIIIFLEGPDIDQNRISQIECALLGGIFHYIILVTFMWMLITAYLQFMRYVKVLGQLRPAHFILKATVCCWGGPLLIVALFLSLDYTLYLKRDNLSDICYPHGRALWYGLLLPIGAIIFVNLVSFVIVLYHICTIPSNLTKSADHAMTLAQLRLSVFLFFLLGLPWIFGMLTTGTEEKLFAYLFCLTAPVQGFVLFVYFVVMDPSARRFWCRKLQRLPCCRARPTKDADADQTTTSANTSFNTYL